MHDKHPDTRTQTIRNVPVDLWARVKAKAALQRRTIRAVVLKLLADYTK